MTEYRKTGDGFPCGPCNLPLECSGCGEILTEDNVVDQECDDECGVCRYCSTMKCHVCGEHICCGGCI